MNHYVSVSAKKEKIKKRKSDSFLAFAILGPMVTLWVIVCGVPILFSFIIGFCSWENIVKPPRFSGLQNFIRFFKDSYYYTAWFRSMWIGFSATFLTILIGFAAALLMNLPLKLKDFFRTVWYIPAVTSVAAMSQILNVFINSSPGILNEWLEKIGLEHVIWNFSFFWSVFWIIAYTVWKGVGASALIWLAGLQSIDPVLYEASSIDGANSRQKFFSITLPGIKPIATYVIITGIISAVQLYEQVLFITNGGPMGKTEVLVMRMIKDAFYDYNIGMSGASSVVLTLTVIIFTIIYFKTLAKDGEA